MAGVEHASAQTSLTVGGKLYNLDLSQIPYLQALARFQQHAASEPREITHGPIDLFDEALAGIQSGFRQCFRRLPANLSLFRQLCETYDFLLVDVLGNKDLEAIGEDLKTGQTQYELEYKRHIAIKGDKGKARDTAFLLLYMILMKDLDDTVRTSNKVYNLILFVVSHPGTFKVTTRTVLRAAYEERFIVSAKQRSQLDRWVREQRLVDMEEDLTTEVEESDGSYFSD